MPRASKPKFWMPTLKSDGLLGLELIGVPTAFKHWYAQTKDLAVVLGDSLPVFNEFSFENQSLHKQVWVWVWVSLHHIQEGMRASEEV